MGAEIDYTSYIASAYIITGIGMLGLYVWSLFGYKRAKKRLEKLKQAKQS